MSRQVDERVPAIVRIGYPWWLRPWLPRDVLAITLGRRIYVSREVAERRPEAVERLLRHELAHVRQVERHGVIGFLARYVAELVRHLWRERSITAAYWNVSFEIEARAAEVDREELPVSDSDGDNPAGPLDAGL